MNPDIIKKFITQIEYECNAIRMSLFANVASSAEHIWAGGNTIVLQAGLLQEAIQPISQNNTVLTEWRLMLRFGYNKTHLEHTFFTYINNLCNTHPRISHNEMLLLINAELAKFKLPRAQQYMRITIKSVVEYQILFESIPGNIVATLIKSPIQQS